MSTLLFAQDIGKVPARPLDKKYIVPEISNRTTPDLPGSCPPNLGFEEGTFNNWNCFTGTTGCLFGGNVINVNPSAPIIGRHTILTAQFPSANDAYGLFPINAPDGSTYCMRLGNTGTGSQAERISYTINVPAAAANYSINYDYAVVFQNPNHTNCEQPRFTAKLFDPVTQDYLLCGTFEYVATGNIPGFQTSPVDPNVRFKPWASAFIDLTDYVGRTLKLEFTTADCTLGGHWGYAYLDVHDECNLTADVQYECTPPNITTLTGPPGFQAYKWWNFDFSVLLGTTGTLVLNPGLAVGTNLWIEVFPFSGNGCRDTLPLTVTVNYPAADFNTPSGQCLTGNNFSFTSNSTIGRGTIVQEFWDFGDGITAIGGTVSHSYALPGTYTVKLVAISALGCKDSTFRNVAVHPEPIARFTQPADQCLLNNNFSFSSSSTIISGSVAVHQWDFGDGNTGNGMNVNHSYSSVGTFTVKLVVTSDKGCKDSITHDVIIQATPVAAFAPPAGQCFRGHDFSFTSTSSVAGGSIVSTIWYFGDNTSASGTAVNHIYAAAGTYNVKLEVTSNFGCVNTLTIPVSVYHQPVANFDQPAAQCHTNNNVYLNSTSNIGGGNISNYFWDWGDGNTVNANPASHWYSAAGTYTIRHIVTSDNGCIDSIKRTVTIHPQPSAIFSQPVEQCYTGNNFSFNSNSTVPAGYSIVSQVWHFGDGITAAGPTATHTYATAGSFNVKLMVTSDKGCLDSLVLALKVNADPIPIIVSDRPLRFCIGDSLHLSSNSLAGSGTISALQWYRDGVLIPGATGNSIPVYQTSSYQLKVWNSNGCVKMSGSTSILVDPLPIGNIPLPPVNFICEGSPVVLSINSPGNTYQWFVNNVIIPGATGATYPALQAGIYSVLLTSPQGCQDRVMGALNMIFYKKPLPDFEFPTFCAGTPIDFNNLTNTNPSGPVTWNWSFGDAAQSTAFNPTHTYTKGGSYSIKLMATPIKCPNLVNSMIKKITVEEARLGKRYWTVNAVKNLDIKLSARDFGMQYLWMPLYGLDNPRIQGPTYNYDQPVEYIIKIRSAAGCLTYDTQLVRMFTKVDIQVPKAFTPNGDGHNDKLDVFTIGIKELLYFRVFNRWGQLLYETKDPMQRWDGMYKGVKQPLETYVWMAEGIGEDGSKINRRGQTILIR